MAKTKTKTANSGETVNGDAVKDAPTTDPPSTDAKPKRGRGAPLGNKNRQTHGLRAERSHRDAHLRRAERDVREVLKSYALESDPMAKLVGRQLRRLEAAAGRLEERLGKRGWFTNRSEPAPAFASYIGVVDRLLGEARRMLERLAGMEQPDGDQEYTAFLPGGVELDPDAKPPELLIDDPNLIIPADCDDPADVLSASDPAPDPPPLPPRPEGCYDSRPETLSHADGRAKRELRRTEADADKRRSTPWPHRDDWG